MEIALIGYGKMGKAIEKLAIERGHSIVLAIGIDNLEDFTLERLKRATVAIEFTGPESAFSNIMRCFSAGLPVVCGSTGWLGHFNEASAATHHYQTAFLYASNFSLGVNLFFAINRFVAGLMKKYPSYAVHLKEIHHTAKIDAPSGTAITLADQIIDELPTKTHWVNSPQNDAEALEITSIRRDPAPGTHVVTYQSDVDVIRISHEAISRTGFALGAVLAAEHLVGKKGVFTMKEVLGL